MGDSAKNEVKGEMVKGRERRERRKGEREGRAKLWKVEVRLKKEKKGKK